jgi:hypothetical protein
LVPQNPPKLTQNPQTPQNSPDHHLTTPRGTTGQNEKLFATAIFGVVKLISSLLCAFFLIDFIGRKRSLSTGITIQFLAMLYMAIFLLSDNGIADKSIPQTSAQKHAAMGAIVMIYFSGFGWALGWNVSFLPPRTTEPSLTKTSPFSTLLIARSTHSGFVLLVEASP